MAMAHLKTLLTVYDALMMSPELRGTLVEAFLNPEVFAEQLIR